MADQQSPTMGMTLGERIAHVGGRENAQGYIEFGSPMVVDALIQHVLRDLTTSTPQGAFQARYRIPGGKWSSWGAVTCGVKGHEQELRYLETEAKILPSGNAGELPIELKGVAEAARDGGGAWRSCSGCHELNEGHDTGPMSKVFGCALGGGCRECGGIGAVWDTTDYAAMGDAMDASMAQSQPSGNAGELDQVVDRQIAAAYQAGMDGDEFDVLAAKRKIGRAAQAQPPVSQPTLNGTSIAGDTIRNVPGFEQIGAALEAAITTSGQQPHTWNTFDAMVWAWQASLAQQASGQDKVDAERYRHVRRRIGAERTNGGKGPVSYYLLMRTPASDALAAETDAAIDADRAAIKEQ